MSNDRDGHMMGPISVKLTLVEIASRAAMAWLAGLIVVAACSAFATRSSSTKVPLRLVLPVLAGRICLLLGIFGLVMIVGRAVRDQGLAVLMIAAVASVVAGSWLTNIAVQVAQNLAYLLAGAPVQKINWRAEGIVVGRSKKPSRRRGR